MSLSNLVVKQPLQSFRQTINPPYKPKDWFSLGLTLFILFTIPLTVLASYTARDNRGKAVSQPDLDVTYIERCIGASAITCSRYNFDNNVDTSHDAIADPNGNGWPEAGESVTYKAWVINKGSTTASNWGYNWYVDGQPVDSGSVGSLAGNGAKTSLTYIWVWQAGRHTIKFAVDNASTIGEISETNNSIEDFTDALAVGFWVEPSVYSWFNQNQNEFCSSRSCTGSNSFEDWAQRQMREWNRILAESKYPDYPNGVLDRVRLDKITVTSADSVLPIGGCYITNGVNYCPDPVLAPDSKDKTVDMMFGFPATMLAGEPTGFNYRLFNGLEMDHTLIHELSHARYLEDLYRLDVQQSEVLVKDDHNNLVAGSNLLPIIGNDVVYYNKGSKIMGAGPDYSKGYDQHSVAALNRIAGLRARGGNYNPPPVGGEFFADLPYENKLRIIGPHDNNYQPLVGAQVRIFQPSRLVNVLSIDNNYDMEGTTDVNGIFSLGSGYFPFANLKERINANKTVFLVEIRYEDDIYYRFMEITDFNLACWAGNPKAVFVSGNCNVSSATYTINLNLQGLGADTDNDLFSNDLEFKIGTDPFDPCVTGINDAAYNRQVYPPDLTGIGDTPDGFVRVGDILKVVGKYFSEQNPDSDWKRYDLNGDGRVIVADILMVVKSYFVDCPGISGNVFGVETGSVTPNLPPLIRIHDPDVTNDGKVTVADISAVTKVVGGTNEIYDLDADGKVTSSDITVVQTAYFLNWPLNNVPVGKELKLYLSALDIEGDSITHSADLPSGAKLTNPDPGEKNRRLLTWKPAQKGDYTIKFKATSSGQTSIKELKITVK